MERSRKILFKAAGQTADDEPHSKAERRKNLYAQKNHYSEIKT
jgi:hypothetical protein